MWSCISKVDVCYDVQLEEHVGLEITSQMAEEQKNQHCYIIIQLFLFPEN